MITNLRNLIFWWNVQVNFSGNTGWVEYITFRKNVESFLKNTLAKNLAVRKKLYRLWRGHPWSIGE
jgi:hypothetical protein